MMETRIIINLTDNELAECGKILLNGGLVAFPTETVYGLGANALDPEAAKKIYAAKGRPSDNPLIIHLSDVSEAEKYCEPSETYQRLAKEFLPGPLTVIMQKKSCIPDEVTAGLQTVAVRVPSNEIARKLIDAAGVPIAAPSANLSGRPSTTTAAHVVADLYGKVDAIIDGGECEIGLESTIIKLDGDRVTLLRPGAVTVEMLKSVCGADKVDIDPAVLKKFEGGQMPLAPGMKYRHYAPRAKVVLLDAEECTFNDYVSREEGCGVLCYDEQAAELRRNNRETGVYQLIKTFGAENDFAEQAHELFAKLREFDDDGFDGVIYVPMPAKDGIGLAVFNRLVKAAGFEILKI